MWMLVSCRYAPVPWTVRELTGGGADMQHDRPGGRPEEADEHGAGRESGSGHEPSEAAQIRFLEEEVALLRRKLTDSPRHARLLEQRLAEGSGRGRHLRALREEGHRRAQRPSGYGVFLAGHEDGTVDVFTAGRKMRVAASPAVEVDQLRRGQSVRLNQGLTIVEGGALEGP